MRRKGQGDEVDLFLVRHGESENNVGLTLSRDSALTERGRQQALRTAIALQRRQVKLDRILCSPLLRAMETASIIGRVQRVRPQVWVDLTERGFCGDERGAARSQLQALFPSCQLPAEVDELGWARQRQDESDEELSQRMRAVARRLLMLQQEMPAGRVLVIIHGGSGSFLLRHLFGIPLGLSVRFDHDNCGLSSLVIDRDGITVSRLNDTSHLDEEALSHASTADQTA